MIDKTLKEYIEQNILPLYEQFDKAHQLTHVQKVIDESLRLAKEYNLNENMAYTIAAFHDTGLRINRETHHTESAKTLLADKRLHQWFSDRELAIMAEAVEDHRASSKNAPRSIYGKIVAEADRDIDPVSILRRTVQFGLSHYPELTKDEHFDRFVLHLHEKYAEGGYLKLWIPESENARNLQRLRAIIRDKSQLREAFEQLFSAEQEKSGKA